MCECTCAHKYMCIYAKIIMLCNLWKESNTVSLFNLLTLCGCKRPMTLGDYRFGSHFTRIKLRTGLVTEIFALGLERYLVESTCSLFRTFNSVSSTLVTLLTAAYNSSSRGSDPTLPNTHGMCTSCSCASHTIKKSLYLLSQLNNHCDSVF